MKPALCAALLSLAPLAGAAEKPNVVFILGDDQAWWDYGFMYRAEVEKAAIDLDSSVYQVAQTPAIDRLADEGIAFTHGYTTPLCRPSLAATVTGTYPHHNRVTGNDLAGDAPDEAVEYRMQVMQTLPRTLHKRLGYTSFQTGKWWEGHHDNGGFTAGDTVNSQSTDSKPSQWGGSRPSYVRARHGDWGLMIGRVDYVNDVAGPAHPINYADTIQPVTDFIDAQVAAEQPFFLWYAPFLPHTPHDPPAGLRDKYDTLISEPDEAGDYIAKYYANIERFDGGVGALLDHLDSADIADSTIVVMICDNGWINKTTASAYDARSKRSPYEGGVRTPIIVRWPDKIRPGGEIEPQMITTPVSVIDLAPTVLAALGLEPSREMHGINLLNPAAVAARDTIFGEVNDHDIQDFDDLSASLHDRFARRDGWKLILPENGAAELYQLYDAVSGAPVDPFETNDRATSETARVAELTAAIESWYSMDKSLQWSSGTAQTSATHLLPLPPELGQTFTPTRDGSLAAVRVVLKPTTTTQSLTLELRELDAGAPSGDLLAGATLMPDQMLPNETRWYLFSFSQPVPLTAGQTIGLRLTPAPAAGGFEVAYRDPGNYSGGQMFYSGLINGHDWAAGAFDMTFETFDSNYPTTADLRIRAQESELTLNAMMSFKGTPMELESTTDMATWTHEASDDNLDGLACWSLPRDRQRQFFRTRMNVVGDAVTPQPIQTGPIYEENFAGAGANLNGVTPDTTVDGITWTAPADGTFLDDGSLPTTGAASAYLPFVPEHGSVYTLSVEVEMDGIDQDRWLAFGFLEAPPGTSVINSGTGGVVWALSRNLSTNDNQVLHENISGGAGSVERGDYVTGAATVSMSLVLDTTAGAGTWTYDWIVDGVTRVDDRPIGAAFESAIGGVGISKRSGSTAKSYRSFSLVRDH